MDRGAIPTYDRLMTKTILMAAAVLVTGCADDDAPNPHVEAVCGDTWDANEGRSCDIACEQMPTADELSGDGCETRLRVTFPGSPDPFACPSTFIYGDSRGCCLPFNQDRMTDGTVSGEPERTRRVFFVRCK